MKDKFKRLIEEELGPNEKNEALSIKCVMLCLEEKLSVAEWIKRHDGIEPSVKLKLEVFLDRTKKQIRSLKRYI